MPVVRVMPESWGERLRLVGKIRMLGKGLCGEGLRSLLCGPLAWEVFRIVVGCCSLIEGVVYSNFAIVEVVMGLSSDRTGRLMIALS